MKSIMWSLLSDVKQNSGCKLGGVCVGGCSRLIEKQPPNYVTAICLCNISLAPFKLPGYTVIRHPIYWKPVRDTVSKCIQQNVMQHNVQLRHMVWEVLATKQSSINWLTLRRRSKLWSSAYPSFPWEGCLPCRCHCHCTGWGILSMASSRGSSICFPSFLVLHLHWGDHT